MRVCLGYFGLSVLLAAGCVKGNPVEEDSTFDDSGGTFAVPDCGYSITTRPGAEIPQLSSELSIGTDPTPRLVHLGFVGDPRTSMVVQWRTADEETRAGVVRFGVGANLTEDQLTTTVEGLEFRYHATGTQLFRQHQAHMCGLTAGTTYSYQVGSEGHFSPIYTFHTAPDITAEPDNESVFGVIGDSRDGYDVWGQLAGILEARKPDLILFTGDAVTIGLTQPEWEEFFGRAESLLATTPMSFAHGNHEVNATPFFSQVALPGNQENFGFDWGYAHVTVANDTPEDLPAISGSTKDAIRADFQASQNATWKLFMHHQPMWSSATAHGSSMLLQMNWMPLVDEFHIDLVLNGHDHDFEISKPMFQGAVAASNAAGTVYAVVGGAGAELYGVVPQFHTSYAESTHSASVLTVNKNKLELEAFRPDGTAISDPGAHFLKMK